MNIKELRALTGLSQAKFAEVINIPAGTIRNWEQEIRKPPEYVPALIEKVLRYEGYIEKE